MWIMQITFNVQGINELENILGKFTENLRVTFDEEAHEITEVIRTASEPYVPYRTGDLELSSNRNMIAYGEGYIEQDVEWAAYNDGFNYALVQETEPFRHTIKPDPGVKTVAEYAHRGITESSEEVKRLLIEILNESLRG